MSHSWGMHIFRAFSLAFLAFAGEWVSIASAHAADVDVPPFYAAAAKLKPNGKLGQVIAKEVVATSIPNATAWRIAYISSDVRDQRTIATGLVVAPKGPPPKGGRPIVAWAHGTTGTAQNCGPSQVLNPAQELNEYFLVGGTSWTDFGVPSVGDFITQGYVIVATDYQGLGGGGRHQYAVSGTQGRDVIDSIRAAGSLGLSGASRKAVVYGWSVGGGATLGAASMPDYMTKKNTVFDGIEVVGFVALAPFDVAATAPTGPLDDAAATRMLQGLSQSFTGNVMDFAHYAMSLWALPVTFPDLALTDVFTDEGAKAIDAIMSKKCMHAGADTISYTFGATYKQLLREQPSNAEAWARALLQGSVARVPPVAPVVIYWGTKDVVVPPVMGQRYREQMCSLGANVTRVQLPGEQTHFSTPGAAAPMYGPWIKDRFAGKALANGCTGGSSGSVP